MKRLIIFLFSAAMALGMSLPARANIVMKVLGVNPSKTKPQQVEVKFYLPKEVTPQQVVQIGDLELVYDHAEESYYVYGTYTLAPEEVLKREVELLDIWKVPDEQMQDLERETQRVMTLLEGTELEARGRFLLGSIMKKLQDIYEDQRRPLVDPVKYMNDFREHQKRLKDAEQELLLLRSLVSRVRILPQVTVWKVFVGIIGFLGLLAVFLTVYWLRQSRRKTGSAAVSTGKLEDVELDMEERGKTSDQDISPDGL